MTQDQLTEARRRQLLGAHWAAMARVSVDIDPNYAVFAQPIAANHYRAARELMGIVDEILPAVSQ